jgi:hypothetical protein
MHQSRVRIDTNMRLHAEVPLITLLALVHFWITLAGFVLGRGRGCNQRRINDRSFPQKQPFLCQMAIDGVEDRFTELMAFQQVTEVQKRRGVRRLLSAQINANKAANGLAVVKGILNAFVRQTKALLGHIHPQHSAQANRWPSTASTARIERCNGLLQYRPRCNRLNLGQKPISTRQLLRRVFQFRKTRLHAHSRSIKHLTDHIFSNSSNSGWPSGINQRFPRRRADDRTEYAARGCNGRQWPRRG